jgi:DNA (cytosine-5)-methyltransferase 1
MKHRQVIEAADLFCGAGGTSTGLYNACHLLGRQVDLLAINHWPTAIESHEANHPDARHICERLEAVRPEEAVRSGHLDILVASPECTYHSNARGGLPVSDQLRASAWQIPRWLEALKVDNVLLENVKEFRKWGPVGSNGRPLKSREGQTYQAFLNALRSLNYTVEDRVLNAADYGDATSRERLFIQARKGRKAIVWPEPTHGEPGLFGDRQPHRTAREIIDWSLKGKSIFNRKKPLAPATLRRIATGLKKFGGKNAAPFLVMLYGTNDTRSIDRPMPTVTAGGQHIALCEPFVLQQQSGGAPRSVNQPLPTVATKGAISLVQPFLVKYHGNHKGKKDGEGRSHTVDKPVPTLDTSNRFGLVEPFVTIMKGKSTAREIDSPLPTVTTQPHLYLCEPCIVKYYGTGSAQSVDEPLDTITTKDRFGLVEVVGKYQIDILFRMLQPHELAAAMSLDGYILTGTKDDQIKQIGNAVPVRLAQSLCLSLLQQRAMQRRMAA